MRLHLYNTLTRSTEIFTPADGSQIVRIYSCGPTVYNTAHIGNLRSFLSADLIQRTLRVVGGYDVRWVMNITDIDDKIIRDSSDASPNWVPAMGPQSSDPDDNTRAHSNLRRFTEYFTDIFLADLAAVGIRHDHFASMPRATAFIPQMQELVREIHQAGFAYERDGSVYFNVSAYREKHSYGRLFSIDWGNFREGARIDADEYDRDSISDFVLWKARKDGEPYWDFVFHDGGAEKHLPGRPGWHLECSAMSRELIGPLPFDIHTGGIDLRFPHHEDELAQCCAAHSVHTNGHQTFTEQANVWMHNEFLEVEGQKMSKSLGNFFVLSDLRDRGLDPLDVRLALIGAHYRSVLNFTFDGVKGASVARRKVQDYIWNALEKLDHHGIVQEDELDKNSSEKVNADVRRIVDGHATTGGYDGDSVNTADRLNGPLSRVFAALADDIHTPKALAELYTFVAGNPVSSMDPSQVKRVLSDLRLVNEVIGVWSFDERPVLTIPDRVVALAEKRELMRKTQQWAESDRIRKEIADEGWEVKDTKDGYSLTPRQQ